jgi:hypothetical protein
MTILNIFILQNTIILFHETVIVSTFVMYLGGVLNIILNTLFKHKRFYERIYMAIN